MRFVIINDEHVGTVNNMSIQKRKKDHIEICLDPSVEVSSSCFDSYRFVHNALPELDFSNVSTEMTFFGYTISAPLMISSMTGGSSDAETINHNLALAASRMGIPLALGSQRVMIEDRSSWSTFDVKSLTENIPVFGNFGAVNVIRDFSAQEAREVLDFVGADAVFLHLNSMQEVVQEGGDVDFSGVLDQIVEFTEKIGMPVIVKEVGFGISAKTAERLLKKGISWIDVSGTGGTSWSYVEAQRSSSDELKKLGEVFADWGNDTCQCLVDCSKIDSIRLISSGGVRSGVDVAKSLVMGADIAAMARPFLLAACTSDAAVERFIKQTIQELKVAMFGIGVGNIDDLKQASLIRKK